MDRNQALTMLASVLGDYIDGRTQPDMIDEANALGAQCFAALGVTPAELVSAGFTRFAGDVDVQDFDKPAEEPAPTD
jgi:hypothetical protein